jgi:hypothetical protein
VTQPADSGPPKDVSGVDLWTKLTQLPRPQLPFEFSRKHPTTGEPTTGKVVLQPITEAELMACRAAAEEYARLQLRDKAPQDGSLGYREIFRSAVLVEFLWRATLDANAKARFAPSSAAIRQYLFPDEIAVLYEAAQTWQTETGPIVSQMSPEEMEAWVKRLAEGAGHVPLAVLSSAAKNDLLRFLAVRLAKSSTVSGSVGSPPDGSSASPSEGQPPADGPQAPQVLSESETAPEQHRDE